MWKKTLENKNSKQNKMKKKRRPKQSTSYILLLNSKINLQQENKRVKPVQQTKQKMRENWKKAIILLGQYTKTTYQRKKSPAANAAQKMRKKLKKSNNPSRPTHENDVSNRKKSPAAPPSPRPPPCLGRWRPCSPESWHCFPSRNSSGP